MPVHGPPHRHCASSTCSRSRLAGLLGPEASSRRVRVSPIQLSYAALPPPIPITPRFLSCCQSSVSGSPALASAPLAPCHALQLPARRQRAAPWRSPARHRSLRPRSQSPANSAFRPPPPPGFDTSNGLQLFAPISASLLRQQRVAFIGQPIAATRSPAMYSCRAHTFYRLGSPLSPPPLFRHPPIAP